MHTPHQPSAYDEHTIGSSTKHHVLFQGSSGERLQRVILEVLKNLWEQNGLPVEHFPVVELEHPADISHGDWSTNVALQLAKPLRKSPREIAAQLVDELEKKLASEIIERVEIAGPGFINFFLKTDWLLSQLNLVLEQKEQFGQTDIRTGQTIMIEHTQPNTHKTMHVGHLRNTVLGMAEVRLHRMLSYQVLSANYQGDVGPHVAKCIYGLQKLGLTDLTDLQQQKKALAQAYVVGNNAWEDSPEEQTKIKEINKAIYQQSDPELTHVWKKTRQWSLDILETIYQRLNTSFDRYYFESECWQPGIDLVMEHLGSIFQESDGAIIFDGEAEGLHKRVFITQQQTATYEAKELALAHLKSQEYNFDHCVVQTGNEQQEYFRVLLAAINQMNAELAKKFSNEVYGFVTLPDGKMSSRKGNVVLSELVLDQMVELAFKHVKERSPDLPQKEQQELSEQIGVGAVKYGLLKYDPKQDITFDFEKTLSFSGNSGPYLQYVCVRIKSMLEKAREQIDWDDTNEYPDHQHNWSQQLTRQEQVLLRKLYLFPEIIIRSTLEYKPNYLCTYLFELAQGYNDFYLHCPVISAEEEAVRTGRLQLSQAVLQVMTNGLHLLGIKIPKLM